MRNIRSFSFIRKVKHISCEEEEKTEEDWVHNLPGKSYLFVFSSILPQKINYKISKGAGSSL